MRVLKTIVDYMKDDEFRLTLFKDRVHAINYDEVLSLESDLIRMRVGTKTVYIRGNHLVVSRLLEEEILIMGYVQGIEMK